MRRTKEWPHDARGQSAIGESGSSLQDAHAQTIPPTMKFTPWTRRSFLATTAAALAARTVHAADAPAPRKKLALIATEVRRHSHAQHFIDRHALGYNWGGQWLAPRCDLVALYVDQFPEGDLARIRSKKYGIPIFSSIADAVTLGTGKLAVDG